MGDRGLEQSLNSLYHHFQVLELRWVSPCTPPLLRDTARRFPSFLKLFSTSLKPASALGTVKHGRLVTRVWEWEAWELRSWQMETRKYFKRRESVFKRLLRRQGIGKTSKEANSFVYCNRADESSRWPWYQWLLSLLFEASLCLHVA